MFVTALPSAVFAAGGDFSLDFTAAAPLTYDHRTGGGAYNDRTVGDDQDIVESLEGGDYACGDIVTFLTAITVDDKAKGNQTIELDFNFTADTTGQSGAALGDIVYLNINYGDVQNGAGPGGTDSGITDDEGSIATLAYETLTGDLFQKDSELLGTVQVTDLGSGEQVILRVDVRIYCDPGSSPTGNLQARLAAARVTKPKDDTISGGAQTIPFKQVGDIQFPALDIKKTVTSPDGTCPGQESINIFEGGTVKYCYEVTNSIDFANDAAYNLRVVDDNGTPGDPSDDFNVDLVGLTDVDGDGFEDDLALGGKATGEAQVTINAPLFSSVTNTAMVDAEWPAVPDYDSATVNVNLYGDLVIEKTVTTEDGNCLTDGQDQLDVASGDTVRYCYKVENIGTVPLDNLTVIDDNGTPNDTSDDITITLTGLTDEDEDGIADDLDVGAIALGEATVQINVSVGSEVVSTATASADDITPAQDSTTVVVSHLPEGALVVSVTVLLTDTNSTCPGADVLNIFENTPVIWCYEVSNTTSFDIEKITVTDDIFGIIGAIDLIPAGGSEMLSLPNTESEDAVHVGSGSGTDQFGNTRNSNQDHAAVNVLNPYIEINKTVSEDGNCPGADFASVVGGSVVTYCFEVKNTGETLVSGIEIDDPKIDIITLEIGVLESGESWELKSGPVTITEDVTNVATIAGTAVIIETQQSFPVKDSDTAIVDALLADLVLIKEGTKLVNMSEADGNSVTYKITVENRGEAPAKNVTVTDTLPSALTDVNASGPSQVILDYDTDTRLLSLSLEALDVGENVTIVINAKIDNTFGNFGKVFNEACANTETLESNYANNCDDHTTWVAPGGTATIGFWKNHPTVLQGCLDNYGEIDLGYILIRDEAFDGEIDATRPKKGNECGTWVDKDSDEEKDNALESALGLLKANVSHLSDGTKRSRIDQVRIIAGRQVLAAICNETFLGTKPGKVIETADGMVETFVEAAEILGMCNVKDILKLGGTADLFNNSGTMILESEDFNPGPADPFHHSDDPTDPTDPPK
jgi:uncharacterized repeat protein (TIGR01451 family)